ncbi:MAG: hypothetical protein KIT14_16010 [bacterium]|nr:hypothetical protein [bacterium]
MPACLVLLLLLLLATPAAAARIFTPLGHLPLDGGIGSFPTDVSADGRVVVGYVSNQLETDPSEMRESFGFRWSDDGLMTKLPCVPYTVSNDGRTLAGTCLDASDDPVLLVDGAPVNLALNPSDGYSPPTMVSGDGQVAFTTALYTPPCAPGVCFTYGEAVRVTSAGAQRLGFLPGDQGSEIRAISSDGSVAAIINYLPSPDPTEDHLHFRTARWQGSMQDIGTLPAGADMFPTDISTDGSAIVGFSILGDDVFFFTAWRWTAAGGLVELPVPFGGTAGTATATSVSGDGQVIVGGYLDGMLARRAVVWTADGGVRDLQDMMELEVGVDLKGWNLMAATAMSRDGSTIAGVGLPPAWPYPTGWRIGPPPSQLKLRFAAARMTIPDHRGEEEHEFRRDPALVTAYGRTAVPIVVSVSDEDDGAQLLPNATVTISVESVGAGVHTSHLGLSLAPDDESGPEEMTVSTGPSGEATVYLHVEELYRNVADGEPNATGFEVTARWQSVVEKRTIPVEDNRKTILDRYRAATDYFPDGARSGWRDAFLPPVDPITSLPGAALSALFQPGNTGAGSVLCNTYQARALTFLNDIRHSDDGWLLNGLDYSPLQTVDTDHHFVGFYPHGLRFDHARAIILDPWLPQTIAYYSWEEWATFLDRSGGNVVPDVRQDPLNPGACVVQCGAGNFVPPYYPAAGGRYPYFEENASLPIAARFDACLRIPGLQTPPKRVGWCQRHGFSGSAQQSIPAGDTDHATVLVGSPVQFLVTQPDGRRFGFTSPDPASYVNDFAGEFSTAFTPVRETDGGRGWYLDVPPGRQFRLELPAIESGTMDVAVLGTDGVVWGGWLDVPITAGRTTGVDVDLDAGCPTLLAASGIGVACERPTACAGDAECPSDDPCVPRACVEGMCRNRPVDGHAAATCTCDRPRPAACDAPKLPRPLVKATAKACRLLKGKGMANARKRPKLLTRAGKALRTASKALGKRAVTRKVSDACRAALSQRYAEAAARVEGLR